MPLDEPKLTPLDWQVMSIVWELGTADANVVSELLQERWGRAYSNKTAGVSLARLAKRGHLQRPLEGRGRPAHQYRAAVTRKQALLSQFAHFLHEHTVQPEELALLQAALASLQRERA